MSTLKLLISSAIVSILVSIIYLVFEFAVVEAIDLVWLDFLDTSDNRIMVIPLTIGLGFIFFAAQRYLGNAKNLRSKPAIVKLASILVVGFFSLFAGASLGPEAVLIPASIVSGLLVSNIFKIKKQASILSLVGIVALFVAFFNSIAGGLLGLYFAQKQKSQKLNYYNYILVAVSSVVAYITLGVLSHSGSFEFPEANSTFTLTMVLLTIIFFLSGLLYQKILKFSVAIFSVINKKLSRIWLRHALVAGGILCLLFLLGGELVQFTGNESIVPVFEQAKDLGLLTLLWVSLVKVVAIAWSHSLGYRGGLIFPLIFVASAVVSIATIYTTNFNVVISIFVFLAGALFADRNTKIITTEE